MANKKVDKILGDDYDPVTYTRPPTARELTSLSTLGTELYVVSSP